MHYERILILICILQSTVESQDLGPRLIIRKDDDANRLWYKRNQSHTVFFLPEGSDDLFVGVTDAIYRIDLKQNNFTQKFSLKTTRRDCEEDSCENVITVMQQFQDSLFVCGTNGMRPQCWNLHPQGSKIVENCDGVGISPFSHTQNSLSLSVEGNLYAAAPLRVKGANLQFRRMCGNKTKVWMYNSWTAEPTFIFASWVSRQEDPQNDKIYIFFREKNSDKSPEADPWISRVSQVCKVDEGGSKRLFQNIWTSFLKARLVCGIPADSLYFNRLQDIFVQHADNWKQSRVYGLFSSSWNSTAVCVYSMEEIDRVFEHSAFKGFSEEIPNPRPGMCVSDSKNLPLSTISVIRDHPEMEDWVHPIQRTAPFYISSNNYTKITVDKVMAADGNSHNVLFLATESGRIHKILEKNFKPFVISETRLFDQSVQIQSMKLVPQKKKLYVGCEDQIAHVDLQRCKDYGETCERCVLARDPYCAWSQSQCAPVSPGAIQNVTEGNIDVCHQDRKDARKRQKRSSSANSSGQYAVPLNFPLYLSCPINSLHATYTWEHNHKRSECHQTESNCLHLITAMNEEDYGSYACISREQDYTEVIREYQLNPVSINVAPHISALQSVCSVVASLLFQLGI
uniref:Semaphorin 7A (JohnMiltonHagen blood group) n=1 Tax=Lepisosteus oculatus TaxID=7918 RepID=W5NCK2_LEPOC|nr:PREDICTED: semaphorin-7A [Lepisosteus oculatus]